MLVDRQRQRAQERERDRERPPAEDEAARVGWTSLSFRGSSRRRAHDGTTSRCDALPPDGARRIATSGETVPRGIQITSRLQRAVHLLLVTAQLEETEARLTEATEGGHRLRAWRAARDVDRLWDAIESQRRRLEPPAWRLADSRPRRTGLEPAELLHARLQGYISRRAGRFSPAVAAVRAVAACPGCCRGGCSEFSQPRVSLRSQ